MLNVGGFDRVLRIVIGLALISLLYFVGQTFWMWAAAAVGVVLAVTAITGFCPIYRLIGLHTNRMT
jgi:Protein of unknown function (DUF2892)